MSAGRVNVLQNANLSVLEEYINEKLQQGWILVGAVQCVVTSDGVYWIATIQAPPTGDES